MVLAGYLAALGLSGARIGVIIAATLLGSAALTLGVGLRGHRVGRRRLLQLVSLVMVLTGLGFAAANEFWGRGVTRASDRIPFCATFDLEQPSTTLRDRGATTNG